MRALEIARTLGAPLIAMGSLAALAVTMTVAVSAAEDPDTAGENMLSGGTDQWWVAHLTAAFQGAPGEDSDEEDTPTLGITSANRVGSFCFLEVIREAYERLGMSHDHEGEDVAHEAGHQFGLDHHECNNQTYLMAGEEQIGQGDRMYDTYCPCCLRDIRKVDHPITDP